MHALRNAIEQAQIAVGLLDRQVRQVAFQPDAFDNTATPVPKGKTKAYPDPRNMSELDTIVVHVTGVRGGFGVTSKRVRELQKQLGSTTHESINRIAQRIALHERYKGTPYHQIGAANGDVVRNHPLERRSWHANAANFAVGCAFDCANNETLDLWQIDTFRKALGDLYWRVCLESPRAWADGVRIIPHRCSNADRRKDTDVTIWREVVLPLVAETPSLRIDYEFPFNDGTAQAVACRKGGGLPVPITWDPRALYDAKGRRL